VYTEIEASRSRGQGRSRGETNEATSIANDVLGVGLQIFKVFTGDSLAAETAACANSAKCVMFLSPSFSIANGKSIKHSLEVAPTAVENIFSRP